MIASAQDPERRVGSSTESANRARSPRRRLAHSRARAFLAMADEPRPPPAGMCIEDLTATRHACRHRLTAQLSACAAPERPKSSGSHLLRRVVAEWSGVEASHRVQRRP